MLPAGGWACQPETRPFRLHAECLTIGSNTQSASLSCSSIVRERNALRRRPCDVRRSNLLPECPSLGPASDAPDFGYCEMRRPVLLNGRAGITTWPVFGRLRIAGLQWGDRSRGEPVVCLATTAIDLPPGCLVSHLSLPGNVGVTGVVARQRYRVRVHALVSLLPFSRGASAPMQEACQSWRCRTEQTRRCSCTQSSRHSPRCW